MNPEAVPGPPAGRVVMRQRWRDLLFLHWPCPPQAIAPLLPAGLEPETYQGRAYVGLVPFTMHGVRPVGLPALPGISDFPEINVRTYAKGPRGEPGVWFFSLDAAGRVAVALARAWFGLPYFHATMSCHREPGGVIAYDSRRRGPSPAAGCRVRYAPRGPVRHAGPGTLEGFLIERYVLHARRRGRLLTGRVCHEPYPIRDAEILHLEEDLIAAAGLPAPEGPPLAHYIPGVDVDVYAPRAL
jgi:uncharacterized protein YqjF (DUF2071 family)